MSRHLAESLVKDKIISAEQFLEAREATKFGGSYIRFLINGKYIAENKLLEYLSNRFRLHTVNLSKFEVSPDIIKLIPADLAKKSQMIPIQSSKGILVVALCDPTLMSGLDDVGFRIKLSTEAVLTSYSAFDEAMGKYYGGSAVMGSAIESMAREVKQQGSEAKELVEVHDIDQRSTEQDAPVIIRSTGYSAKLSAGEPVIYMSSRMKNDFGYECGLTGF